MQKKCWTCYTGAKWQPKNNGMLDSQLLSFVSSMMLLNHFSSDPYATAILYALSIQHRRVRAAEGWESCLLLVFDSKLLAELNWHNHTGSPDHPATVMTTACGTDRWWRRKSHLHGYFLCLVVEASLQEAKWIQSFQIAEGKKLHHYKGKESLLNTKD